MKRKGMFAAAAAFAASPQGRRMIDQARTWATGPQGRARLQELRTRAARSRTTTR